MTEEVQQQEDDAAFAAGFAEARGDEPPAQEAKPEPEAEAEQPTEDQVDPEQQEGEPEQEGVEEEAEAPIVAGGLTDAELTAMLAKLPKVDQLETMTSSEIRKVYGKIGELQQKLNALGTGSGSQAVRIDPERMKRLQANYPELAQDLVDDLSEALQGGGSGPAFDPQSIEPMVEQRVSEVKQKLEQEMEMKLLAIRHRDWQQVAASDEFKVWAQTLPEEDQQQLDTSWDSGFIGDKISDFKSWKETRQSATQTRQQRLQQAVTPQGKPQQTTAALSEDEALLAGWKAVRG